MAWAPRLGCQEWRCRRLGGRCAACASGFRWTMRPVQTKAPACLLQRLLVCTPSPSLSKMEVEPAQHRPRGTGSGARLGPPRVQAAAESESASSVRAVPPPQAHGREGSPCDSRESGASAAEAGSGGGGGGGAASPRGSLAATWAAAGYLGVNKTKGVWRMQIVLEVGCGGQARWERGGGDTEALASRACSPTPPLSHARTRRASRRRCGGLPTPKTRQVCWGGSARALPAPRRLGGAHTRLQPRHTRPPPPLLQSRTTRRACGARCTTATGKSARRSSTTPHTFTWQTGRSWRGCIRQPSASCWRRSGPAPSSETKGAATSLRLRAAARAPAAHLRSSRRRTRSRRARRCHPHSPAASRVRLGTEAADQQQQQRAGQSLSSMAARWRAGSARAGW